MRTKIFYELISARHLLYPFRVGKAQRNAKLDQNEDKFKAQENPRFSATLLAFIKRPTILSEIKSSRLKAFELEKNLRSFALFQLKSLNKLQV
ncbi:hypothetical protein IW22_18320 [Chryseobacterium sp. JM1]|nr:hypothetical protein IW22_18320 [Chryseobacterium sp. JM1]